MGGERKAFLHDPRRYKRRFHDFPLNSSLSLSLALSGPPGAPTNCSVVNRTTDSLEVACEPGFHGGLRQIFHLELIDLETGQILANDTADLPEFQVNHVEMAKTWVEKAWNLIKLVKWRLPPSSMKALLLRLSLAIERYRVLSFAFSVGFRPEFRPRHENPHFLVEQRW